MSNDVGNALSPVIVEFQQKQKFDIKIAGNGGQGIILAGNILGAAAINANLSAVQMQSYGAAARGSNVLSDVIIQRSGAVNFPVVKWIDLLVAFTQQTLDDLLRKVKPNGIVLVDEDLVEKIPAKFPVFKIPATRIAQSDLKNKVVANLVMLGGIFHLLGFLPQHAMENAIKEAVPEQFCELNLKAFNAGIERASHTFSDHLPKSPIKPSKRKKPSFDE